ncbi:MAG: type II toxin-antitoxin system VapC family toxin [Oscillospiraceae bacterium]|nr:type II toxin-antitoxin system VapC family toxin [Oscillospiraceae bacterium]
MTIFLDTDTLSFFLSGNSAVAGKMNEAIVAGSQICLTCINVYEIAKGLKYRNNKNREFDFYKFLTNVTVFYLDDAAIQKAADIYANLRKTGITVGDADILIASIVITNAGKLITNNNKHYQYINGLTINDWFGE